jgi:UDP:flavonoid glycosyltransferase YjiC (YdhE family)
MGRISVLMLPEPGHLLPTFRVATKLKERGHEIHYLSFPEFRKDIVPLGFDFSPIMNGLSATGFGSGSMFETQRAGSSIYRSLISTLVSQGKSLLTEMVPEVTSSRPDLLIIDSGLVAIERMTVGYSNQVKKPSALRNLDCVLVRMSTMFTEFYKDGPRSEFCDIPELILCPQRFDLPNPRPTYHKRYFVEPSIFERRPEIPFPWEWIDANRRLVYCSLGTQSSAYKESTALLCHIVRAFEDLRDFQLVIGIGGHLKIEELGTIPANVFVSQSVPQLDILKRASLLITHGGLGTLKEAIMTGIPMIVFPFAFDQPFNAKRVTHHGVGRILSTALSSGKQFAQTVREVIDDAKIRSSLLSLRAAFRQVEQSAPSIFHIERLLAGGIRKQRPSSSHL